MPILTEEAKSYIGFETEPEAACDLVERGAVRRYAQAIMDEDPIYWSPCEQNARYGGPVAPLLFPTLMFRRAFGALDPIQENARNPDFDGFTAPSGQGLPPLPGLEQLSVLNGGSELEFFRYARHNEQVIVRQRYAEIYERETSKGAMVFVVVQAEYRTSEGELLARVRRTQIRR
jgi:hypothetical protein